jgi:hypothetical protein
MSCAAASPAPRPRVDLLPERQRDALSLVADAQLDGVGGAARTDAQQDRLEPNSRPSRSVFVGIVDEVLEDAPHEIAIRRHDADVGRDLEVQLLALVVDAPLHLRRHLAEQAG